MNKADKKWVVMVAAGFIVIAGIAFTVVYNWSGESKITANTVTSLLGTKESPHTIDLTKDKEEPTDLVIKTGEYVQFNSKDGKDHQLIQGAASEDHGPTGHTPSPLDSGIIKGDEGYLLQFNETGKYEFHDNYNHHATITVIVYDPSKSTEDIKLKP